MYLAVSNIESPIRVGKFFSSRRDASLIFSTLLSCYLRTEEEKRHCHLYERNFKSDIWTLSYFYICIQ